MWTLFKLKIDRFGTFGIFGIFGILKFGILKKRDWYQIIIKVSYQKKKKQCIFTKSKV
jgi:hypothetical protein